MPSSWAEASTVPEFGAVATPSVMIEVGRLLAAVAGGLYFAGVLR